MGFIHLVYQARELTYEILSIDSYFCGSSSSMRDHPEPDVDDTPIVPKFKSFEEMLEEKLVLDQDQPKTPDLEFAATPKSGSNSPKPFLRYDHLHPMYLKLM